MKMNAAPDFQNYIFLLDFFDDIESSIENRTNLDAKNVVNQLSKFCLSEKFIPFLCEEFKKTYPFWDIITILEIKEKYLSLNIIFPLFEELNNENFKNQIKKFKKIKREERGKIFEMFIIDNGEDIVKIFTKINEKGEFFKKILDFFSNNKKYIEFIFAICLCIFIFLFYELMHEFLQKEIKNLNLLNYLFEEFKRIEPGKEAINSIIEYLKKLNLLNHTKNPHQNLIFLLNLIKYEQEISLRDQIDNKFFEYFGDALNINDKLIWTLYEKDISQSNSDNKYIKKILEGKMTEKEKFNFDFFDTINKLKVNTDIKGISGNIYKSIFYDENIILIIKIDLEFFKNNKITLDQIQNEIKLIQNSCPKEYKNLNLYAQIENKIINLDFSFDLFINELKYKNIIAENKINEKINKINLPKEKEKGKELFEKELEEKNKRIKALENELIEEKNKNKKSETINMNLKKDLDKEIKKYNDLKKELDNYKASQKKLEKEAKESLIETIIEKDKEIKELKLKLSRLPFVLEEGEKLMSIIFISSDQKLHFSVICKNTDKFHKIEGQLYESFPEYSENDNFFILNGKKINRYKTLEENGIKNNDIIILNEIE